MSREVLDSRSPSPDELVGERPYRSSLRLSTRLPTPPMGWRSLTRLVLAFLIGALGGALAWDAWRDRQDAAAASAAVDLTARLRNVPPPEDESTLVQAYVQLENDGPEQVRIEAIEISGAGYVPRFDATDEPFVVESEDTATQRAALDVICHEQPDGNVQVAVRVLTADDVLRTLVLPLEDEQRLLRQTRLEVCDRDDVRVGVLAGGTGEIVQEPTLSLRLPIVLESYRGRSTVVTSVAAATPLLEVTAEGIPVEINDLGSKRSTLIWRVVDCAGATTLDFWELGLVVSGHLAGGPTVEAIITVDPDVALDVAAFVADTCRTAEGR